MNAAPPPGDGDRRKEDIFERRAGDYDQIIAETVRGTGFAPDHFHAYKVETMRRWLDRRGIAPEPAVLLNYGCGTGASEPWLRRHFPGAAIRSCDPSPKSLAAAAERNRDLEEVAFAPMAGGAIPFPGPFGLAFTANVFHHIPRAEHPAALAAIRERLAPGGHFFLFEHNPWNPVTRRAVNRCPLDEEAVLLSPRYSRRALRQAGFRGVATRFTLFFPGWLRPLLPLERLLAPLPLGAQYFCVGRR